MRYRSYGFLIVVLVLFYSCQSKDPDPRKDVRFVSESYSSVLSDRRSHTSYVVSYNESGAIATVRTARADTSNDDRINVASLSSYQYDSKGYLLKQFLDFTFSSLWDASMTSVKTEAVYTYDSQNRLSQQVNTSVRSDKGRTTGSSIETRTFTYDAAGKLAACSVLITSMGENLADVRMTEKKNFTYRNGVLVKYTEQPTGSSTTADEYTVSNGLLLQKESGNTIITRKTYDSDNNLTKEEFFAPGNVNQVFEYAYDKAPVPKSLVPPLMGHPQEALFTIYDNRSPNNVIKETILTADRQGTLSRQSETSYTTAYNSDGLLIEKSWRDQTNPANFRKYTYTYQ